VEVKSSLDSELLPESEDTASEMESEALSCRQAISVEVVPTCQCDVFVNPKHSVENLYGNRSEDAATTTTWRATIERVICLHSDTEILPETRKKIREV
jgi:hypothetical protein